MTLQIGRYKFKQNVEEEYLLKPSFDKFTNKDIRHYLYNKKLASSFLQFTGKHPRKASREELVKFLEEVI